MASLPTRTTASFDAIKPVSSLVLLDNEFNQYVGASGILNGGTTGTKLLVKTSDATDPPVDQDQIGAGLLARWKQNGTLKASITKPGQITTAIATGTSPLSVVSTTKVTNLNADQVDGFDLTGNKAAWAMTWFFPDPSTPAIGDDTLQPVWLVPAGTSITTTRIKVVFFAGSHTSGGDVEFGHVKRNSAGAGATLITSLHLNNTNNLITNTYTADFAVSLTEGDQIACRIQSRSGTISERSVSVSLHGTQQFTT